MTFPAPMAGRADLHIEPSFKTASQLPPSAGLLLIPHPCGACAGATTGEFLESRLTHFAHFWQDAAISEQNG